MLKDIHNIKTGKNHKKRTPDEEHGKIKYWLSALEELYHQYITVENDHIQGIYMQDETMKTTFPEVILLDATHKTNDLRMPLYLMLTADSNGESEVVSAFIVTNEEEQTIHSMIQTFKEHNPAWELVTVALTDKDMVERKTLTSEMPAISLLICLFHVLRTFKREITTEKMDITSAERTEVLEILQKLAYSSSEDT